MGFFDSSSSSETTNVTNTKTATAGAESGIAAADASTVNILDPGAVALAKDVAAKTIEASGASLRSSLDFGESSLVKSLDFSNALASRAYNFSADIVDKAGKVSADTLKIYSEKASADLNAAVSLSKGQTQQITENITKWSFTLIAILAAAGVAIFIFNPRGSRGNA